MQTKARRENYPQIAGPLKVPQVKMPQVVGFSVGQQTAKPQTKKSYGQGLDLKKVIGVALMLMGVVLVLSRCFFGGDDEKVEEETVKTEISWIQTDTYADHA